MSPTDQQCAYGFPTQDEFRPNVSRDERGYFGRSRLIPGMNFTCNGTITRVIVGGVMRSGNQKKLKLHIWKEDATEPGIYHRSGKAIVLALSNNMCNGQNRRCTLQLMGGEQISVEPGDILGIEVPPSDDADFELHSVPMPGLMNYVLTNVLWLTSLIG